MVVYHKSFGVLFTGPGIGCGISDAEKVWALYHAEHVPNTYVRFEGNELEFIHYPIVYGMKQEDEKTENAWGRLCDIYLNNKVSAWESITSSPVR